MSCQHPAGPLAQAPVYVTQAGQAPMCVTWAGQAPMYVTWAGQCRWAWVAELCPIFQFKKTTNICWEQNFPTYFFKLLILKPQM